MLFLEIKHDNRHAFNFTLHAINAKQKCTSMAIKTDCNTYLTYESAEIYTLNTTEITWKRVNISPSSYTILQQKVNLHTAGCGRLNTPSGVTVTPKRMKANTLATRPLKEQERPFNNIQNK
jgi:hypothetical protein